MTLSIIIPAYNEQDRLPRTLAHIEEFFADAKNRKGDIQLHEILVVDDGSADRTSAFAMEWAGRLPVRSLRLSQNLGKGAACREGMLHATGEYLLLYDADAATPMSQVPKLFSACAGGGYDIAIGSRVHGNVDMTRHRRLIGRIYHTLCRSLVPGLLDTACGCKLFRRDVAHDLFRLQRINRFAFDVEILFLALQRGYRIAEIPVEWHAIPESKVRILRDGMQMFSCVLGLYGRKLLGSDRIERHERFVEQAL